MTRLDAEPSERDSRLPWLFGRRRARLRDRVVAEAVRCLEQDRGEMVDDALAEEIARKAGGTFENRLIARARALQVAEGPEGIRAAMARMRSMAVWIFVLGTIAALVAGAATARATMETGDPDRVNFYWVLGGVLGVQTIALVLWIGFLLLPTIGAALRRGGRKTSAGRTRHYETGPDPAATVSLGTIALAALRWLFARFHQGEAARATLRAATGVHAGGAIGRWTFSAISHGLWVAFNVGCITLIMLMLAARQYTFGWETTILTAENYIRMTETIAYLPDRAGFTVPKREQIAASQFHGPDATPDAVPHAAPGPEAAREAWAGLLVGAMIIYGFAPRVILFGLSLSMRRRAARQYRLDITIPEYARLKRRLMPATDAAPKPDVDDPRPEGAAMPETSPREREEAHDQPTHRPTGPPAIVGLEIRPPSCGWPPAAPEIKWDDLGFIETRDDLRQAAEHLRARETDPAPLVLVADLTTTPDRGIGRMIDRLRAAVTTPPVLILTAGQHLRERNGRAGWSGRVDERVRFWRELAAQHGIAEEHIIEMDLDHLTTDGKHRLADLARTPPGRSGHPGETSATGHRHIEEAFTLIETRAGQWLADRKTPEPREQAELQREIAALYQGESAGRKRGWKTLLHAGGSLPADPASALRASAERMTSLMPDVLKRSPKWLAAGAMAGAMSCLAAAALVNPIALAALPSWSALGAALGGAGLLMRSGASDRKPNEVVEQPNVDDAVRAAALFTAVLELQGRPEREITRILERAFDPDPPALADRAAVHHWLNETRHRLDIALAEEATP